MSMSRPFPPWCAPWCARSSALQNSRGSRSSGRCWSQWHPGCCCWERSWDFFRRRGRRRGRLGRLGPLGGPQLPLGPPTFWTQLIGGVGMSWTMILDPKMGRYNLATWRWVNRYDTTLISGEWVLKWKWGRIFGGERGPTDLSGMRTRKQQLLT